MQTSVQRATRRAFLEAESIIVFGGTRARIIVASTDFQIVFRQVVGRGDAALAAFARATGYEALTMERRLYNLLINTLSQLQVPIRRV